MHAVSHSVTHRGPPATRSRARWQPYNSLQQSLRSPSSSSASSCSTTTYLHTPASSVSSSPTSQPTPLSSHASIAVHTLAPLQRDCQARDAQKTKFVVGLVDQAVKSLCEIWHPHDIPAVFLTSSRATVVAPSSTDVLMQKQARQHPANHHSRNTQLPSPVSPTTQRSPPSPSASQEDLSALSANSNLVPIKGFVHEVLRRSRTSGSVLQTALCYLEAIRSKVPELVEKEKAGEGVRGEPDGEGRIVQASAEEIEAELQHCSNKMALDFVTNPIDMSPASRPEDICDTVRVQDDDAVPITAAGGSFSHVPPQLAKPACASNRKRTAAEPLPTLPALPSPLLCPRRAFLASLILASKFTQDRCYSNRAWAKLSGLPPREIGRCERALGEALEWRLWVGKKPVPAQSASRPVARCKSEGDLLFGPRRSAPAPSPVLPSTQLDRFVSQDMDQVIPVPVKRTNSGLRRHATVPANCFSAAAAEPAPLPLPMLDLPMYDAPQSIYDAPATMYDLQPAQTAYDAPPAQAMYDAPGPTALSSWDADAATPSPQTPPLSASPASTDSDSSGGGRTVQMHAFVEPPPGAYPTLFSAKGAVHGEQGEYAPVHAEYAPMHGSYSQMHGDHAQVRGEYVRTHGDFAQMQMQGQCSHEHARLQLENAFAHARAHENLYGASGVYGY